MSILHTLTHPREVIKFITHGGNVPGTPASRAGYILPEGATAAVIEAPTDVAPTSNTIAGMPIDQIIMLGGFALATMIIATPSKKRKGKG